MLKGDSDYETGDEESSTFEPDADDAAPQTVPYNPKIPIDTFDVIIVDECHRSIYGKWRHVLEYFDAFVIGLTATPYRQTRNFFNQNLVSEYRHEQAVADNVNVGYYVYRIETEITQIGSTVAAGNYVARRDRHRRLNWEELNEDVEYTETQLDRDVVATHQFGQLFRLLRINSSQNCFPIDALSRKRLSLPRMTRTLKILSILCEMCSRKGTNSVRRLLTRAISRRNLLQDFAMIRSSELP